MHDEDAGDGHGLAEGLGKIDLETLRLVVLEVVEGRKGAFRGDADGALFLGGGRREAKAQPKQKCRKRRPEIETAHDPPGRCFSFCCQDANLKRETFQPSMIVNADSKGDF
jgi:hypothetical protein